MEKISGIVPASRRVSSVDMKNSAPVRPGTPTFGRPVGVSTLSEASKPTTAELAIAKQKEMMDKRMPQDRGPEVIQDMADRFFMQKQSKAEAVNDFDLNVGWMPEAKSNPAGFKSEVPAVLLPPMETVDEQLTASPEDMPEAEREFTPPGSYLDVVA